MPNMLCARHMHMKNTFLNIKYESAGNASEIFGISSYNSWYPNAYHRGSSIDKKPIKISRFQFFFHSASL